MIIEQIYTGCLAQGTYYITSQNEAIIIDPLRETQPYLDRLKKDNVKLKYIFETHFHADFVSGHIDLSKKTNAPIVYGPNANPEFKAIIAEDNQIFEIGNIKIKVLHTPGHTMESSCYLLIDENDIEVALFSGDTLFLGDVGRPDLAQKSASMSQEDLAGILYDTLYLKVLPLPDSITVYPAHGAGSACGKKMMKETLDTLGNQKKVNYALNQPNKESFIKAVLDGLTAPPSYFGMNVSMNKNGYNSFDEVLKLGLKPLSPNELESLRKVTNAIILDTRNSNDFSIAHIPNSLNIGLNGDFAPWVGTILSDITKPIILVTELGKEAETITRLSRVGVDNVLGHLAGGINSWIDALKSTNSVHRISADQFASEINLDVHRVIDVRKESEFESSHITNAINKPLSDIDEWKIGIPKEDHFYIHCAGGYRSMIAASILQANGITNFTEIAGGFNAITKTSIPRTEPAIIL